MPLPGTVVFDYDPGKISASDGDPIDPLVDHSGNGLDLAAVTNSPVYRTGVFCGLPSYSWDSGMGWMKKEFFDPINYNNLSIFVVKKRFGEDYLSVHKAWRDGEGGAFDAYLEGQVDGWNTAETARTVTENLTASTTNSDRPDPRVMTFRRDDDAYVYQNLDLLVSSSGSEGPGSFEYIEMFGWEIGWGRVVGVADLSESEMVEWQEHLIDTYVLCVGEPSITLPSPRIGQREDGKFL